MKSIFDLKLEDLTSYLEENGYSKFVSKQIYDWIYKKRVFDFDKMSNIKLELREQLKKDFDISMLKLDVKQVKKLINIYLN